ncbi:MAG: efflux RND transporter periplasmic adaptor subunit [Planctomycetes bacterium]|nr:efflux RND transporter periplasmic adaptor subunit [Planctomycetota bacterium]
MATVTASHRYRRVVRIVVVSVAAVAFVIVTMMWLMGLFHPKITGAPAAAVGRPVGNAEVVQVERIRLPVAESAVGSVRPVYESAVASKIMAKVVAVNVKAGDRVSKGDVLVRLDDADLRARQQQALAAVAAAKAARDQAIIELDRVAKLLQQNAASKIEHDRAETTLKSAEAELQRAEQTLNEADAVLSYATIQATMDALVVDKRVDVGDTVAPGQVLLNCYDPTRMQMVASVRESLTRRLQVGQNIEVTIDALGHPCEGQISEIVPEAESASRTFLVKVTGPCPPGVYAGMFGRLTIPLDEEDVLVIPRAAIRMIGQLSVVDVVDGETLQRRVIQPGRTLNGKIEILSGLREGEQIALTAVSSNELTQSRPNQ